MQFKERIKISTTLRYVKKKGGVGMGICFEIKLFDSSDGVVSAVRHIQT